MATTERRGLRQIARATKFSWAGLKAAWRHEASFRLEVWLFVILAPLALYLGETGIERALLFAPLMLVLIAEITNSAIEAVIDLLHPQRHELAGRAKDLGSAAVFLADLTVVVVWLLVLLD
jgi:diacylglycerol kinase (ATP)